MEHFGVINYMTYVIGCILIILLPGPNSMYVLSLAAQRGVRAGWLAACGIFIADWILMLATAAGAATLLHTYPSLFMVVKYAGAIYLGYIGFTMLLSAWRNWRSQELEQVLEQPLTHRVSRSAPFRKALVIGLLNPKAILFLLSFFVQFVDPGYPTPAWAFLVLALTLQAFSFVYLAALIYTGAYLAAAFRKRRKLSALSSGSVGSIFMLFAAKLATATL
ncbi:MAG TPA: leucine efflux protein LeuE [Thiolinea sp.]|nr:leucine efflux protein LeuE [Thiolinea sp.]